MKREAKAGCYHPCLPHFVKSQLTDPFQQGERSTFFFTSSTVLFIMLESSTVGPFEVEAALAEGNEEEQVNEIGQETT
jgi:hypothetical protein